MEKEGFECPTFVFFDAGWTLLRPEPSVGFHYAEVAQSHGLEADAQRLEGGFGQAWKTCRRAAPVHPEVPYGRDLEEAFIFWSGVVAETFRVAGFAPPPEGSAYYREVFELFAEPGCWRLYEDALPALDLLEARGIPAGVLSNFDPRLYKVLEGLGLTERLAPIVISSEAGAEKPSPAIFEHARGLLTKTQARRPALIGDEPEADGHGALRAGWQQCLAWRGNTPPPNAPVRSAPGLVEAVEMLG